MPPVTRRSVASEALRMADAALAPSEVTSPVCHLRPVGDSSLGFTLLPNETKVLGRRDMECMISRMTRRAAHKAKRLSRKQLQVSFNAQAGSCTVKWIGHSHESLLQRASSGAPVLIRRETLELEAGDILWLHAYYSPFNTSWKPGGCAPGFVVDLPPVVERQRAQMQKLAREALLRVASSRVATVDEVRDAIERAQALHIPEQPTARAIAGEYGPARARLATLLRAQRKRRRSLGLEDLSPPPDYLCPVTREVMKNPVVASDGHSYEREVLEQVLRTDCRSPLTREVLQPFFFANLNLKKRILDFEDEAEQFAKCGQKALRLTRAHGENKRVPR